MGSPEDMFMFMVSSGDCDVVMGMIRNNIDVNFQNSQGVTPLLITTEKGDYKMAKLLLENGADCNGKGRLTDFHYAMGVPRQERTLEWTPLINAALFGHPDIVALLIQHDADMNFRDINGRSALNAALQQGHEKCAEVLIRCGAEVSPIDFAVSSVTCPRFDMVKLLNENKKPNKSEKLKGPLLHPAALDGDRGRLRELIKKGADVNSKDNCGNTALHLTIQNGYLGCAEYLIKKGADVNIKGKDKHTALHVAATLGVLKLIPILVENGAVVDARGEEGITPLHCAVFHSFPLCVKQLLNYGASVNATFADGKTALHIAVSKSTDCIELLIKENADIFIKDNMDICPLELAIELGANTFKKLFNGTYIVASTDGITPLHIAARCTKTECLKLMISEGCDVNVVTSLGDTPLHFSCSRGGITNHMLQESSDSERPTSTELLIKAGAEVNRFNNLGLSPIHFSARHGFSSALKILCDFGADFNSVGGDKQQTPLHYAAEAGSLSCIKHLIAEGADKNAVNVDKCTALMLAARNTHFGCIKFLLENDVPLWVF